MVGQCCRGFLTTAAEPGVSTPDLDGSPEQPRESPEVYPGPPEHGLGRSLGMCCHPRWPTGHGEVARAVHATQVNCQGRSAAPSTGPGAQEHTRGTERNWRGEEYWRPDLLSGQKQPQKTHWEGRRFMGLTTAQASAMERNRPEAPGPCPRLLTRKIRYHGILGENLLGLSQFWLQRKISPEERSCL